MKYIGNIITDSKIDDTDLMNVVTDQTKDGLIDGIPTLIVGWDIVKAKYPCASIIDGEIIEGFLYWTHRRKERRDIHEKDLMNFRKLCMKNLSKNICYSYYSLISQEEDRLDSIKKWLLSKDTEKTVYISNDILYIYPEESDNVIGISLRDVEYVGGSKKEIFKILFSNEKIGIKSNDDISPQLKYNFANSIYMIPYIYS